MSNQINFADLEKGQVIAETEFKFTRDSLVRYAGASGDFNPIHYNDEFAKSVGLESVIAHGMLTMGTVIAPVVKWIKDPGKIISYETRFTKPIEVPALGEANVDFKAVIGALDEDQQTARIDLTVSSGGAKVLTKSRAVVKF